MGVEAGARSDKTAECLKYIGATLESKQRDAGKVSWLSFKGLHLSLAHEREFHTLMFPYTRYL